MELTAEEILNDVTPEKLTAYRWLESGKQTFRNVLLSTERFSFQDGPEF
jgi:hypothetical protein